MDSSTHSSQAQYLASADEALDRIVLATWLNPGTSKRPGAVRELLPESHLRTLLGLLILAGDEPFMPFDHPPEDVYAFLAPRKRPTTETTWEPRQLQASLAWLLQYGYLAQGRNYTYRILPDRLPLGISPRWKDARTMVRAVVRDLRLSPVDTALLVRCAYYADKSGTVVTPNEPRLTASELGRLVGVTGRTLTGYRNGRAGHLPILADGGRQNGIRNLVLPHRVNISPSRSSSSYAYP